MATISDLKHLGNNSLVWETERPFPDASRTSSSFWLLDSEYRLHFGADYLSDYYLLLANEKRPWLKFNVVTFIQSACKGACLCEVKNVEANLKKIWSQKKKTVDEALDLGDYYSKVTITCIFTSDRQITVRLHGSETAHLATQIDFDRPSDLESLSHDLSDLLGQEFDPEEFYCDVELECEDRTFQAHKFMLTARSKVFAAMFRNKMAESETATVHVTDMNAEELDVLLKYMYSGKLPGLSFDATSRLYAAGDKYRILALRKACSELLVGGLTTENCLPLLVLADAHSDDAFKERVTDFVAQNLELLKKEAWSGFNEDHPVLVHRVYQKCLATKLSKQP